MNAINHEQAQQWVQARLAGTLSPDETQALDAHLQDCPDCRRYAIQIEKLDAGLRRHFRENSLDRPQPRAAYSVVDQVRAKMFAKRVLRLAGSATLLLGLVALVGVLASLTTRVITPAVAPASLSTATAPLPIEALSSTATPLPTKVMLPSATPGPLGDAQSIAAVLQRLAGQNAQFLHRAGWVRTQSSNAVEDGSQTSLQMEAWQHYPQTDGICTEGLFVEHPRPDMFNVGQVWSGGLFADPVVRDNKGKVKVKSVTPADVRCVARPENTDAGELAARLLGQGTILRKDAGKDLQGVRAWYETLDEQPVFEVEAKFTNEQSVPPAQVEQYTFNLETGLLLRQNTLMQKADGTSFVEFRTRYQTDYYAQLPAEAVPVYQKALSDLQYYVSGQGSAAPTPTPSVSVLDTFPASPDVATNDMSLLESALRALRERHLKWISNPGWYLYENPAPVTGDGLNYLRRTLIHSTSEGRCELMTFYRTGSKVFAQEVRLANGQWGLIGSVLEGSFTEGSAQDTPCTLDTLETVEQIDQRLTALTGEPGTQQTQYRAWIGSLDASAASQEAGQAVLVLVADTTFITQKPGTMDPDTKALEPLDRQIIRYLYDLKTGTPLGEEQQLFLSNGKVLGDQANWSTPQNSGTIFYSITYFSKAPADLGPVFAQTVERLKAFLKQ